MNKLILQNNKMNKVSKLPLQKSSPNIFRLKLNGTPQHAKNMSELNPPNSNHYKIGIDQCNSERKLKQGRTALNKFYSFKKIRQGKVKQKNDQGKVIMQVKLQHCHKIKTDRIKTEANNERIKTQVLNPRISDLNEARTISSKYSPRESNFSIQIHESQIIERAIYDYDRLIVDSKQNQPYLQKKKISIVPILNTSIFSPEKHLKSTLKNSIFKKIHNPNANLMIQVNSRWLCHYEIVHQEFNQETLNKISQIQNNDNILCLYAQKKTINNKFMLLYEPYQMKFQSFLRNADTIYFQDIVKYLTQLVNQLIILRDNQIVPYLQMNNVVYSANNVKIKLKKLRLAKNKQMSSQCYEKDLLKDIGVIGHDIINKFRNRGIENLSKNRKISFNNLMIDLVMGEESFLQDAYVRLSVLKEN